MSSLNKAQLIGNIGKDPEIRFTPDGRAVANMTIATSENWKDKQTGEKMEKTEWHKVVFFGRIAEVVGEYLKKGSKVYVEGKIQTRKWQGKDGQDRYTTEVVARDMIMLGDKQKAEPAPVQEPATEPTTAFEGDFNGDVPF